jgi:ketosteroid isomerase-like protein
MNDQETKNLELVLAILDDEVRGDIPSALEKMHPEYKMTWMYQKNGKNPTLFPHTLFTNLESAKDELNEAYTMKDRNYDIITKTATGDIVTIECIESYTDPMTDTTYRTPLVIILQIKNGKIFRGRHYCDPAISYMHLDQETIKKVLE